MYFRQLGLNEAEERLETLRRAHWAALKKVWENLPQWDEYAFWQALDDLGWTEHRMPLHILWAEREDWEKGYHPLPYGAVNYRQFSSEWRQEKKTAFFLQCRRWGLFKKGGGRFSYAGKKGMALSLARGREDLLRLIYTDYPILYDMDKIGVGFLIAHESMALGLEETLQSQPPQTSLPMMLVILS